MSYENLDPNEAQRALQSDASVRLLDVRTQPEHDSHRLPGATLIPVQELMGRVAELDPSQRWFVYCEHGVRSASAYAARSVVTLVPGFQWLASEKAQPGMTVITAPGTTPSDATERLIVASR